MFDSNPDNNSPCSSRKVSPYAQENANHSPSEFPRGFLEGQTRHDVVSTVKHLSPPTPPDSDPSGDEDLFEDHPTHHEAAKPLVLHELWTQRRKRRRRRSKLGHSMNSGSSGTGSSAPTRSQSTTSEETPDRSQGLEIVALPSASTWDRLKASLVTDPSSKKRLVWDVIGMVAMAHDLLVIPFQLAFQPQIGALGNAMAWSISIFWTLDIPRSFLVGYYYKGKIEMSISKIARRYMSGWFALDITLVSLDWALLLADAVVTVEAMEGTSYMQVGKILRFMRMVRLLRLLKVSGTVTDLFESVQSETFRIISGIGKLLVSIMIVNHLLACGFYWTGTWTTVGSSWVVHNGLLERSLNYRYMTALHWSLTQFTPASMEVVPKNWVERTYAVCTLLFALVTFSSFVSSLTGAMTQLRNLNSDRLEQCMVLRRYLRENKIDPSLASRIWCWVEHKPNRLKKRTLPEDVDMLMRLPQRLQNELKEQVYSPILVVHPFFLYFHDRCTKDLRFVYECITERSVEIGQEVFLEGEVATDMFFVASGVMQYIAVDNIYTDDENDEERQFKFMPKYTGRATSLRPGSWISELALWFKWKHTGQFTAASDSDILCLNAEKFRSVMTCELQHVDEPGKYARLLARFLLKNDIVVTDLWADKVMLSHIAAITFDDAPSLFIEQTPPVLSDDILSSRRKSLHLRAADTLKANLFGSRNSEAASSRNSFGSQDTRRPSLTNIMSVVTTSTTGSAQVLVSGSLEDIRSDPKSSPPSITDTDEDDVMNCPDRLPDEDGKFQVPHGLPRRSSVGSVCDHLEDVEDGTGVCRRLRGSVPRGKRGSCSASSCDEVTHHKSDPLDKDSGKSRRKGGSSRDHAEGRRAADRDGDGRGDGRSSARAVAAFRSTRQGSPPTSETRPKGSSAASRSRPQTPRDTSKERKSIRGNHSTEKRSRGDDRTGKSDQPFDTKQSHESSRSAPRQQWSGKQHHAAGRRIEGGSTSSDFESDSSDAVPVRRRYTSPIGSTTVAKLSARTAR